MDQKEAAKRSYNNATGQSEKNKVEEVKADLRMTIGTSGGPVLLVGSRHELMKFKAKLEDKENRQKFIPCPQNLMETEPWIEQATVKPAEVAIIVIVDPSKEPRKQNLLVPSGPGPGFGVRQMGRS